MSDTHEHDYSYDEESLGFAEPPRATGRRRNAGEWIGAVLVALGLLFLILEVIAGRAGTWAGMATSFGAMTVGAILLFVASHAGTQPGIKHDRTFFRDVQNRGWIAWGLGVFLTGFYVVLYFYDELQTRGMAPLLERPVRMIDPLAMLMTGKAADRWFLYGFVYSLAILAFGVRMIMKYRHNRYQIVRTISVMFFQLGFAFLLPNLLKLFKQPEFYFTYFWPLKQGYLWPGDHGMNWVLQGSGRVGLFMIGWGIVATFFATPVLTYFFGKRWYCSWVCGCGGLAETLGDPWRQLSDKSTTSWRIERWMIHSVLVFIVVTTAILWINSASQGRVLGRASGTFANVYGFAIGSVFSGVIGVGFYPLMGSRVWCRFGCPMAAILGIFQRWFSRFRITTNGGQCMSCGNCSTYCEMGIDVRAYAQSGENIVRASCVGCGVCAAVCPRGVLRLENGSTHAGRYEGPAIDSVAPPEVHRYKAWSPPE